MKVITILLVSMIPTLLGACCLPKKAAAPEYRLIRPERKIGNVTEPALYEKAGDTNHVYMRSLSGGLWHRLPR